MEEKLCVRCKEMPVEHEESPFCRACMEYMEQLAEHAAKQQIKEE